MKHLLITLILALTCTTAFAQSVTVKGTGAGAVRGTGAGSVRGYVIPAAAYTNYCDGRFTVWNTNQDVVVDNDSGLTWTRNANLAGTKDWTNAFEYCSNLTYAAHEDWRLPSIIEFSRNVAFGATNGLIDAEPSANDPALPLGHPFTDITTVWYYWSSTMTATNLTDQSWHVYMQNGGVASETRATLLYVWPVRGP